MPYSVTNLISRISRLAPDWYLNWDHTATHLGLTKRETRGDVECYWWYEDFYVLARRQPTGNTELRIELDRLWHTYGTGFPRQEYSPQELEGRFRRATDLVAAALGTPALLGAAGQLKSVPFPPANYIWRDGRSDAGSRIWIAQWTLPQMSIYVEALDRIYIIMGGGSGPWPLQILITPPSHAPQTHSDHVAV